MMSKSKIADPTAAYDTSDTVSLGGILGGGAKKKAWKALDVAADLPHKKIKSFCNHGAHFDARNPFDGFGLRRVGPAATPTAATW